MINIPPISGNVTPVKPPIGRRRTEPVAPGKPIEEDTPAQTQAPFVERRKYDDRRQRSTGRGPFNQRAGRDRRRNHGQPSVDTEV